VRHLIDHQQSPQAKLAVTLLQTRFEAARAVMLTTQHNVKQTIYHALVLAWLETKVRYSDVAGIQSFQQILDAVFEIRS
jgi:hypothetical protein